MVKRFFWKDPCGNLCLPLFHEIYDGSISTINCGKGFFLMVKIMKSQDLAPTWDLPPPVASLFFHMASLVIRIMEIASQDQNEIILMAIGPLGVVGRPV